MKHLTIALAACLAFAHGLTNAQPPTEPDSDAATVVKDSNTFALDLYSHLAQQEQPFFLALQYLQRARHDLRRRPR